MPTNKERREVARKLRSVAGNHREVDKEYVHEILGLYMGECVDGYDPLSVMKVADLIESEPEVDRDALLYLAQDLEVSVVDSGACGDVASLVLDTVAKIRKACGEQS